MSGHSFRMNMRDPAENEAPATVTPAGDATPASTPAPSFFVDSDGLRPVWRLVIYVAAYYLLRLMASIITGAFTEGGRTFTLWTFLWSECLLLLAAVVPAFWLSRPEGRTFEDYGLPLRGALGKNFWYGVLWGLAAMTCLLLLLRAAGVCHFEGFALHGTRVLKFAAFWAAMFFVVALYEDFLFRGYAQFTLAQAAGFWPAALLLSAVFGAIHLGNPGERWTGALGAGCIGLFFCLTLRRTGNLWFAIGMHAAWDWAETFLYGVPDSGMVSPGHLIESSFAGPAWLTGGTVGPEGSALLFVLIAVMWVAFVRLYPGKKQIT